MKIKNKLKNVLGYIFFYVSNFIYFIFLLLRGEVGLEENLFSDDKLGRRALFSSSTSTSPPAAAFRVRPSG